MSIQKSKITLLEEISTLIRREHYSLSTERTYCAWVRQFVKFHHMQTREILLFLKIWLCKSTPCRYFISKGWIHIKTVILRNALLSAFSKNIKQLTYAGCQSEIPPNSSRFRMNRKFCYQSATKFSTVILTGVLRSILQEWACGGLSDCEELVGVTHRRWWGWFRRTQYI